MAGIQKLPKSVQEIADVIGEENALLLVRMSPRTMQPDKRYPGAMRELISIYVPKTLRQDHCLVEILGWENACKMVIAFGGETLKPANCNSYFRQRRDQAIRLQYRQGETINVLAIRYKITERQIRNVVRGIAPKQIPQAANDDE